MVVVGATVVVLTTTEVEGAGLGASVVVVGVVVVEVVVVELICVTQAPTTNNNPSNDKRTGLGKGDLQRAVECGLKELSSLGHSNDIRKLSKSCEGEPDHRPVVMSRELSEVTVSGDI